MCPCAWWLRGRWVGWVQSVCLRAWHVCGSRCLFLFQKFLALQSRCTPRTVQGGDCGLRQSGVQHARRSVLKVYLGWQQPLRCSCVVSMYNCRAPVAQLYTHLYLYCLRLHVGRLVADVLRLGRL